MWGLLGRLETISSHIEKEPWGGNRRENGQGCDLEFHAEEVGLDAIKTGECCHGRCCGLSYREEADLFVCFWSMSSDLGNYPRYSKFCLIETEFSNVPLKNLSFCFGSQCTLVGD